VSETCYKEVLMDKEVKEKWVKALRSGEYTQGHDYLCRTNDMTGKNHFCCLGVLCEVMGLETEVRGLGFGIKYKFDDFESSTSLPGRLGRQLGVSASDADILVGMNDSGGKSFEEIANWIEEYL
jgi:hypothetical protein